MVHENLHRAKQFNTGSLCAKDIQIRAFKTNQKFGLKYYNLHYCIAKLIVLPNVL